LDKYTTYTCDFELPADNNLHIYTQINNVQSSVTGIIISNNNIVNIVTPKRVGIQKATNSTIELLCMNTTIHSCAAILSHFTQSIIINLHCLSLTTYKRLKNHTTSLASSKYCISTDWDKLQAIKVRCKSFDGIKYYELDKHLIV
jgi:hypothetical protein